MTKIEVMENQAKLIGYSKYNFTPHDWIEVIQEGDEDFRYFFNGVEYERSFVEEKLPFNGDGFEDESVLL